MEDAHQHQYLTKVIGCLHNGHWELQPNNRTLHEYIRTKGKRVLAHHALFGKQSCTRVDQQVQSHRWVPRNMGCDSFLERDAFEGKFGGVFADDMNPAAYMVLSDSTGRTLDTAIETIARVNPWLRGLLRAGSERIATRLMNPLNFAVLPRSVNGTLRVLNAIEWPPNTTRSRRFILATSGNWYNMVPPFYESEGTLAPQHDDPPFTPCPGANDTGKKESMCEPKGSLAESSLDSGYVAKACHGSDGCAYGAVQWGWYAWSRRFLGSLSPVDYARDLNTFVRATRLYREATIVWVEPTPQHCSKRCISSEEECSPYPFFAGNQSEADVSTKAWQLICPGLESHTYDAVSSAGCQVNMSRWRYLIAAAELRNSGLPVVPIEAALSTRGDLHHIGDSMDCTHYCHLSEGGVHIASAALSVLAALVHGHHGHTDRNEKHVDSRSPASPDA